MLSNEGKMKRRSKNDQEGRDFACGCGKTYLSYPALYTHIKTKHDGKFPEGTTSPPSKNSKGRGRPRKSNTEKTKDIYEQHNLGGGPCSPLAALPSNSVFYTKVEEWQDKPLTSQVVCDDAFALYALEVAKHTSSENFAYFSNFLFHLRNCLNLRGWQMEAVEPQEQDYCSVKPPSKTPEICNFFIQHYLPLYCPSFNTDLAISMTLHFTKFLETCGLTELKLSLIRE